MRERWRKNVQKGCMERNHPYITHTEQIYIYIYVCMCVCVCVCVYILIKINRSLHVCLDNEREVEEE